jgi:hypothetical protein
MAAAFHAGHVISATVANLGAGGAGVNTVLQVRVWCLMMVMHRLLCVRGNSIGHAKGRPRGWGSSQALKEQCPVIEKSLPGTRIGSRQVVLTKTSCLFLTPARR